MNLHLLLSVDDVRGDVIACSLFCARWSWFEALWADRLSWSQDFDQVLLSSRNNLNFTLVDANYCVLLHGHITDLLSLSAVLYMIFHPTRANHLPRMRFQVLELQRIWSRLKHHGTTDKLGAIQIIEVVLTAARDSEKWLLILGQQPQGLFGGWF